MSKTFTYHISGMTCHACETLIERKLITIDGVESVSVDHARGTARLECSREPDIQELQNKIKHHGYTVSSKERASAPSANGDKKRDFKEIGAIAVIVFGVYVIAKALNLIPEGLSISGNVTVGFALVLGLVASVSSCIAVTGGLLLAVSTKYNETHPNLTKSERFRPHIYFNIGRIVSYTVLGGLVGLLGSALSLSPSASGVLSVVVSAIMVLMGLSMLKLIPKLGRFQPRMPKFLAHKIHNLSERNGASTPFTLGALTFFLPCGFTQALQFYALSTGSFTKSALIMFAFSLGTAPSLVSLGALSSFTGEKAKRYVMKFAGVLVILLGLTNINSGLALTGLNTTPSTSDPKTQGEYNSVLPPIENGKQIVNMKVVGYEYKPNQFVVAKGVPVEWRIDASRARGCAQVIVVPKLRISEFLPQGTKTITFTPTQSGDIKFSCSMGMTTPNSKFIVVDNNS